MFIYLVDVRPDRFDIRAVLAESQADASGMILHKYKDYKAKPSIRIYAGYELRSETHIPIVITGERIY